ncbi:hypothetical protein A2U01_0106850, partial [Trifolium medium]|nr:hypothetical protein [Trifolium medium]
VQWDHMGGVMVKSRVVYVILLFVYNKWGRPDSDIEDGENTFMKHRR